MRMRKAGLLLVVLVAVLLLTVLAGPASAQVTLPTIDFAGVETTATTVLAEVVPIMVAVLAAGIGLKLIRGGAKKIGF